MTAMMRATARQNSHRPPKRDDLGMASPLGTAEYAVTLAVIAFGRVGFQRWRAKSEEALMAATDLEDPRSAAERWLAAIEPPLMIGLGSVALLVAVVAGAVALLG